MGKWLAPLQVYFVKYRSLLLKTYDLFTAFDIPVKAHWSLGVMLLLFLLFSPVSFTIMVIAFISLIPHEFAHALAARIYGIGCRQIILLPVGGVALLERMPREPRQELVITGAGPLMTLLLALIAFPFAVFLPNIITMGFLGVNVALFVFNVAPLFPMDGGRFLRAFLASWINYEKATLISVRISQVLAVLFIILGTLFGSGLLPLTMIAVMWLSQMELKQVQQRA